MTGKPNIKGFRYYFSYVSKGRTHKLKKSFDSMAEAEDYALKMGAVAPVFRKASYSLSSEREALAISRGFKSYEAMTKKVKELTDALKGTKESLKIAHEDVDCFTKLLSSVETELTAIS